jgi:hypothetical protein
MKKALIIPLFLLMAATSFAQTANGPIKVNTAVCRTDPDMPKNAVLVWPKSDYTPTQDPSCAPCYEYKNKYGHTVMECPFLVFSKQADDAAQGATEITTQTTDNGAMDVRSQGTYTGNYPACDKNRFPKYSTPVWPKSAYIPTGNPNCAPCYEYTSKHGVAVMECPYLVFLPEGKQ